VGGKFPAFGASGKRAGLEALATLLADIGRRRLAVANPDDAIENTELRRMRQK
jgi:hypothetical protein